MKRSLVGENLPGFVSPTGRHLSGTGALEEIGDGKDKRNVDPWWSWEWIERLDPSTQRKRHEPDVLITEWLSDVYSRHERHDLRTMESAAGSPARSEEPLPATAYGNAFCARSESKPGVLCGATRLQLDGGLFAADRRPLGCGGSARWDSDVGVDCA